MLAVNFLLLSAALFCIGVYGVLARKNGVMVLMSIELILNSVNLNLVAFGPDQRRHRRAGLRPVRDRRRRRRGRRRSGHGADDLPQPPSIDLSDETLGDEGLMLLAAEDRRGTPSRSAGWFLENAWLIPLIPAIAFFVILLFGKRMPQRRQRGRHRQRWSPPSCSPAAPRSSGSSGHRRRPRRRGVPSGAAASADGLAACQRGRVDAASRGAELDVAAERWLESIGEHIDGFA